MTFDHGNKKTSIHHCLYSNLVKIIKHLIELVDDQKHNKCWWTFSMEGQRRWCLHCFSFVSGFVQHKMTPTRMNDYKLQVSMGKAHKHKMIQKQKVFVVYIFSTNVQNFEAFRKWYVIENSWLWEKEQKKKKMCTFTCIWLQFFLILVNFGKNQNFAKRWHHDLKLIKNVW